MASSEGSMPPAAATVQRRPYGILRLRVLVVAGAVVLAVAIGVYYWQRAAVPEPPSVELADADPPVARAIQKARAELARSPRAAAAWGQLGIALLANESRPEARVCFACAERLDPRDPRWPYLQVVRMVENDPEAIAKLARAVELAGDKPTTPRLRLAEAQMGQGGRAEAEAHFHAVLRTEPFNARAHLGLARLTYEQGNFPESLAELRQCVNDPHAQRAARALLAEVHQAMGDPAAAAEAGRLVSQLPEDAPWPDPYIAEVEKLQADRRALDQASALMDHGNLPDALGVFNRLVTVYPDWGEAWLQFGLALNLIGNRPAGEQALRKAVAVSPRSAKAQFSLGTALLTQGKHQAATPFLRSAIELQPNYSRAHYNLNLCQQTQGDRAGAIESLRTALRYQPLFPEADSVLGQLLIANGQKEEGLAHLRSAARSRPEDPKIKKLLEDLQK